MGKVAHRNLPLVGASYRTFDPRRVARLWLIGYVFLGLCVVAHSDLAGRLQKPYRQTQDVVLATVNGKPVYMDVFQPQPVATGDTSAPQQPGAGLAIVDVASGAWHSDRGKIEDHDTAFVYSIFCAHGYTVFAVRPGSRGEYLAKEMVDNVKRCIRYVKAHAKEYGVRADRVGLIGASAGGHLALLAAFTPEPAVPESPDPLEHFSTRVCAVGVFFPPTDFLNWEGKSFEDVKTLVGDLFFRDPTQPRSDEEWREAARAASPLHHVRPGLPPVRIFHGDADPLVPLQQSQALVAALEQAHVPVELTVKEGGGHPWLTIPVEVGQLADWFDKRLHEGENCP